MSTGAKMLTDRIGLNNSNGQIHYKFEVEKIGDFKLKFVKKFFQRFGHCLLNGYDNSSRNPS